MDCGRLPIEVWEAIMDALSRSYLPDPAIYWKPDIEIQRALFACALTCRAWRVRAQHLLWIFPNLQEQHRLALFTRSIQTAAKLPTTALALGMTDGFRSEFTLKLTSELVMQPFPDLQHFHCANIRFDCGPLPRVLRMRLPFFANITLLQLWKCTFTSLRAMLDVVWACENLSSLSVVDSKIALTRRSTTGHVNLSATCEHLRACRKLTTLRLDMSTQMSTHVPVNLTGSMFGRAVTNLHITGDREYLGLLSSILKGSFPVLRSLVIWSFKFDEPTFPENNRIPSWLHVIAASRAVPGTLKSIVIERLHDDPHNACCKEAVGTSEEVIGSRHHLPDLLSGLEELTIRLNGCEDPESCAVYIHSVLPSMRSVLRFQRRVELFDGSWEEYTLAVTQ